MSESRTPAGETRLHNLPEYSVSEISRAVKSTLEENFQRIRVRGEVSKPNYHGSGHLYFSLKDEDAVIDAVCWRGTVGRLKLKIEHGMELIATGRISSYPGSSKYQIVIDSVELAGEGALLKLLEERRKKLAAEGLFDEARKKPLPMLPAVIGVITSPTGAVIRDILHRLADRFPRPVLLWPVAVQGEGAAEQVAAAIRGFNALVPGGKVPRPDLIIVARGGGSLEDLWAFNEEIVVRAVAAGTIPLISAIGHETDTTLIDFVSDRRAPTPTAAAEMAVPVRAELMAAIAENGHRLAQAVARDLAHRRTEIQGLARGLPEPRRLIEEKTQQLDGWIERLKGAERGFFAERQRQVATLAARLVTPGEMIRRKSQELAHGATLLKNAMAGFAAKKERGLDRIAAGLRPALVTELIARRRLALDGLARLLEGLSYESVLQRGFVLVRDAAERPVTQAAAVAAGMKLTLTFGDGTVPAIAEAGGRTSSRSGKAAAAPESPASSKPKKGGPKDGGPQGSLL
ncbi:exodeoxyribonuclease 7 large subunit [Hypericibacter terrae]|uniref:Exodeoxyribonuclease 7 large subunit n=1 Tax=Hypericibacter terrae TaxID=2602015 RepID=A0A5J6ME90_9PROT|nr:exodeoxyribonuclease VII large subunit [Hypericibacter terrae]QEX15461.1 exodeoxyribonuclease 7 large subunit [Hypericibacter terrae]